MPLGSSSGAVGAETLLSTFLALGALMSLSPIKTGTNGQMGDSPDKPERLPPFDGRQSRQKPVEGLKFYHKWNADDFVGKYHKAKFKNPYLATPGTTIVLEEARERNKKGDVDRFEGALAARNKRRGIRLAVRNETTRLRVDLEMKTMLGVPMDTAEKILKEDLQSAIFQEGDQT